MPDFPSGVIADPQLVDRIVALRLSPDERGTRRAWDASHGEELSSAVGTHLGPRAESEFAQIRDRGWALARLSPGLQGEIDAGRLPAPVLQYARVYQDGGEGLFLATGQVTARFPATMTSDGRAAVLATEGLTHVYRFRSSPHTFSLAHAPDIEPAALCMRLVRTHRLEAAWPELLSIAPALARPNDPAYARYQWFWRNTGQSVNNLGGTAGADVAAETAWSISEGRGSVIALIDDGFDPAHEDLAAGVMSESGYYEWTLPGGLQFVRDTGSPTPGGLVSHGNMVAGMAAARAGNRRGGCGMAPRAGLRCIALPGPRSAEMLARAIEYAVDPTAEPVGLGGAAPHTADGADVISCSLLPPTATTDAQAVLLDAIEHAVQTGRGGLGTPVCWAAPNAAGSIDGNYLYANRRVVAVAATDHRDTILRAAGTNLPNQGFGSRLQFVAPGEGVYNTWSAGTYYRDSGCSFAVPIVAGLAALVLTVNPELTWEETRQVIRDGCDKIDTWRYRRGFSRFCGFGRVNAGRTLRRVLEDLRLRPQA